MKTICTMLLCLVTCWAALAQSAPEVKTKKIKNTLADHTATYSVLATNKDVKHGAYEMEGKHWKCEGQYDNGQTSGIWSFYGPGGKLNYKFDFTNMAEVFSERAKDSLHNVIEVYQNGQFVKTKVGNAPFYFGGEYRMLGYIASSLRYPMEAHRAGLQGVTFVKLEIDEAGKLSDLEIAQSAGEVLDKEAMRVLGGLSSGWVPAMIDGKPVKSKLVVPVRFKIM
ncbi:energy transducer TonB [Pontibacter sp. Tf4]|uniref:energy transducer TonB n=1 Tax=Pontibacter sp. Tf4 TaxID=2761620 RepID=UPI0016279747|nr:energy transducer TonB [Pontibacter sp. Tf4]MBB6611451.1 energy transducer TonB [Pontibacter sp. Tf4]